MTYLLHMRRIPNTNSIPTDIPQAGLLTSQKQAIRHCAEFPGETNRGVKLLRLGTWSIHKL